MSTTRTTLSRPRRSGEENCEARPGARQRSLQRMKRNGDVMRADRLKQVMQQIDSSFDEKDVGKSKFSVFVTEAAKRGLVSINKLENGQLEVDVPRPASENGQAAASAIATPLEVSTPAPAIDETEDPDRVRRGGRRGRGRGRDDRPREERGPKPAAPAPMVRQSTLGRGGSETQPREQRSLISVRQGCASRVTRLSIVKRAVASVSDGRQGGICIGRSHTARSLLGRDSAKPERAETSRDTARAHDADIIDLRRRGSD